MKKLLLNTCLVVFLLILSIDHAFALKCGNDLIREGDTTFKVINILNNNGGKILGKERVGTQHTSGIYTSISGKQYVANYEIVEKWFIRVSSGYGSPYCYELTFIGSVLKEIGSGIECK
jgi:hypothetical protein